MEDFLANVQTEDVVGEQAFESPVPNTDETGKETPPAPPADEQTKPAEPSQGGENTPEANMPFHKHPRWIQQQQENARLREFESAAKAKLEAYDRLIEAGILNKDAKPAPIPAWFPKSGNPEVDGQQYQEYLKYEAGVRAQIKQEILEDQTKEAKQKAADERKWQDWVDSSIQKLKDEGLQFDRNELQKVALEYLPSDEHGNIDFKKAYDIMTKLKSAEQAAQAVQSDARKKIADTANTSSQRADKPPQKFETNQSIHNRSWDQLVQETN